MITRLSGSEKICVKVLTLLCVHQCNSMQTPGGPQQLETSKKEVKADVKAFDAKAVEQSIAETLANAGEDGPSNRELLQLLQQQSQLISKYQAKIDHTNATLLLNQKMLQRISTKLEVCFLYLNSCVVVQAWVRTDLSSDF
jgi:hypothetical protein